MTSNAMSGIECGWTSVRLNVFDVKDTLTLISTLKLYYEVGMCTTHARDCRLSFLKV
jgi:hypothetical protein